VNTLKKNYKVFTDKYYLSIKTEKLKQTDLNKLYPGFQTMDLRNSKFLINIAKN